VALCLPGDRPVRAGHRRVCVPAARWWRGSVFFTRALVTTKVVPVEVTTDKAAVYPHVLDELAPGAWHCTELYAINRVEADHGQLKQRLRPMRGLKRITEPESSSPDTSCTERGRPSIVVRFPAPTCQTCPVRAQCTLLYPYRPPTHASAPRDSRDG
jgi:hypothetical protein